MNGYGSRKFLITGGGMLLGFVAALLAVLDAHLAMVLVAGIAGYNAANAFTTGKGNGK